MRNIQIPPTHQTPQTPFVHLQLHLRGHSRDTSLAALAPHSIERAFLRVLGVALVTFGALGFVPPLAPNGRLLGIFIVDAPHNALHLLSGIVVLAVARMPKRAHAWYGTAVISIVYGLLTILGFAQQDTLLGLMRVNPADNLLHLVVAIAALVVAMFAEYRRVFPSRATLKTFLGSSGNHKKTDTPPTAPRRNATA